MINPFRYLFTTPPATGSPTVPTGRDLEASFVANHSDLATKVLAEKNAALAVVAATTADSDSTLAFAAWLAKQPGSQASSKKTTPQTLYSSPDGKSVVVGTLVDLDDPDPVQPAAPVDPPVSPDPTNVSSGTQ